MVRAKINRDYLRYLSALTAFWLLLSCSWPVAAADQVTTLGTDDVWLQWQSLPESMLAMLRGGFETENGLRIAFGVERKVFINGALSSQTTFNIKNLHSAMENPAVIESGDWDGWALVQNGSPGPLAAERFGGQGAGFGTLIQNRLDNQQIQVYTQVNLRLSNFDALKSQSVAQALNSRPFRGLR